jgi:hypothetical protein
VKKTIASILMIGVLVSPMVAADYKSLDSEKGSGGYAITAFDRNASRKVALGGYFDTEFISKDGSSTFRAHRLVLETSAQLHKNLLFSSEIEFEYGAKIAGDSTDTDGELKIEQVWFDYRLNDALTTRTGIVLVPFGRLNQLHDSDVRDTTERGVFAKYIVPTTWSDTGAGLLGQLEFGDVEVSYEGYLINGLNAAPTAAKGIRSSRPGFKTDNNENKAIVGRLGLSPYQGLVVGVSGYTGTYDTDGDKSIGMFGLDASWKNGPAEVVAEWAQIDANQETSATPQTLSGYYVEGRYHLSPAWLKSGLPDFKHPVITLFGRLGSVDLDTSVEDSMDITQYTFGLNFRPIENVAYKFEYEINEEKTDATDNNAFIASIAVGF